MDSGKENDNDDFQTVIRHSRRKSSRERSRGKQMYGGHSDRSDGSRGRRAGERDRDRSFSSNHQYHHHNTRPEKSHHHQNNHQNHPPAAQTTLPNGNGGYVNGLTVKQSSGGVTNGSICSESGSSSLGTTESFVHSTASTGGELENGANCVGSPEGLPEHVRHLSGGSLSGSASTCDTDNALTNIAQCPEEGSSNNSNPKFVVAPPPAVNPWRINSNAASIIAKKAPGPQPSPAQNNIGIARPNGLGPESIQKKPMVNGERERRSEKEKTNNANKTTGSSTTTQKDGPLDDSQKENEFKTVTRSPQRKSFRDRGRRSFQPESRGRRQGERDRDKTQLPHAVPSPQQPPTNPSNSNPPNSSSNGVAPSTNSPNGLAVRSNGVTNGSVCSESGSSSLETPESLVHTGGGALETGAQSSNHSNNPENTGGDHIRHSSGESLSGSASSLENVHNIAQTPEEPEKPQFIVAPPPTVNPWRINSNAASIIAKKTPPASQPQPTPPVIPQTPAAPQTSQKKPVAGETGPEKDKTKATPLSSSTSANSQTVEQSTASSPKIQPTSKSIAELSHPSPRKDTPEPGLKAPLRAFAAVTRSQKGGLRKGLKVGDRASEEDWPTLQEALTSPPAPSTPVAHGKSVITMTHEPRQMTRQTSTAESTTDSAEDLTLQQRKQKLPSDKWPSIADSAVEEANAKPPHTLVHSTSDAVNDETPSEASVSGESGDQQQQSAKTLENGTSTPAGGVVSENGSVSSSDDNEPGLVDNELDADAPVGKARKGKKSKQIKWVPLSLPETPSAKARARKERLSAEREWEKERDVNMNTTKPKTRHPSNKEVDAPVSTEPRSNHTYVARGRGRATGVRGRSGRGRGGNYHFGYREVGDMNGFTDPDYTDYPPDYTTLPPMYPVTEFIMPYMTNGYFPAAYAPSPVADEAHVPAAYVPVDETVVNEMVKKQIEYYFSEENLEKDFYLRRKMDEDGYLPVNFVATFPRVKNMTQDCNVVVQAIQASPDLELKEDLSAFRTRHDPRKWPILDETGKIVPPQTINPAPPAKMLAYQTPNGFVSLSTTSTPTPTFQTLSIAEKFNPNVPEFVPKFKMTEKV